MANAIPNSQYQRSMDAYARADTYIPAGSSRPIGISHPRIMLSHGEGCYFFDLDGNK